MTDSASENETASKLIRDAQKRETVRIQLGQGNGPIVEFPESLLGEERFFRVFDLSEGGLGFESAKPVEGLSTETPIPKCFLEFNALDRVSLTITVKHLREEPQADGQTLWRYGCSFEGLSADDTRLVRMTIMARERKLALTRSRFR